MLKFGSSMSMHAIGRWLAVAAAIWLLVLMGAGTVGGRVAATLPSCPHSSPERPEEEGEEANWWKAERHELAPTGAAEIRLCRYGWPAEHLIRATLLPRKRDGALVAAFDALQPTPKGDRERTFKSCFADSDPVLAYLAYPNGHAVTIYVPTTSCWLATNGELTRSWPPAALKHLVKELLQLTGYHSTNKGSRI